MEIIKKITFTFGFSLILLLTSQVSSVFADCADLPIDNDDPTYKTWAGLYSWVSDSGSFRDDHRIRYSSKYQDVYGWGDSNTRTCSDGYSLYVYLNDASFTDTAADYTYRSTNPYNVQHIRYYNQNTAPLGWNYIGTTDGAPFPVEVYAGSASVKNTGADGIELR